MRGFWAKNGKTLVMIFVTFFSVALMVSAVFMLSDYKSEITDRAISKAEYNVSRSRSFVEEELEKCSVKTSQVAGAIAASVHSENELFEYLIETESGSDIYDVKFVRYFKKDGSGNDVLYSSSGREIETNDVAKTFRAATPDKTGYVGAFTDYTSQSAPVICFYSPVENCEFADAVAIYYTRRKLETFFSFAEISEDASFSVLCTDDGVIAKSKVNTSEVADAETLSVGNIVNVLTAACNGKDGVDQVKNMLNDHVEGAVKVTIGITDYVVAVGANPSSFGDLAVVEIYKTNLLCASGLNSIYTIISIIVLFVIMVVGIIAYLLLRARAVNKKIMNLGRYDQTLKCFNRQGFEDETAKIIYRNKDVNFDMIVMQIRHFRHLKESFGEGEVNNLLRYICRVLYHYVIEEETFGRIEDGQFLLFLHAKSRETLLERLKTLTFAISNYKGANKYNVLLKFGIYETDANETLSPSQMIDLSNEANNTIVKATAENAGMTFNFYDNELRKIRLLNEEMELHMESALQNGEFQVFYQAKYNLNLNRQDGCEALVRWYDVKTGEYNRPALFMSLFETNGFIVKLDKYVFAKVCEYINYSISHGRTVFPVSVNVSRITAVQPDFIEYYVHTKKKYGIADGQIMIEFTESFAYENYTILTAIVDSLHENGFKCSIDDFGCGYSSYKILKSLPMDEIKLDRFFMEDGLSAERDVCIWESIIKLAKDLKMKVTQEGVETMDGVKKLRKLGCDVVQGYVYSHPLALSDYINFVQNTREHNL